MPNQKQINTIEIPSDVESFDTYLPEGSDILSAHIPDPGINNHRIGITFLHELSSPKTKVTFRLLENGDDMPENNLYLGTLPFAEYYVHLTIEINPSKPADRFTYKGQRVV